MPAKFSPVRHYVIPEPRITRFVRTHARAWEPLGAALLVVVLFGLAVEFLPGLKPVLLAAVLAMQP